MNQKDREDAFKTLECIMEDVYNFNRSDSVLIKELVGVIHLMYEEIKFLERAIDRLEISIDCEKERRK